MRAGGAPWHAWTEIETELKALCDQLTYLGLSFPTLEPLVALQITQEVGRCRGVLGRFSDKVKSAEGWMHKIMWAISANKALATFRREVIERKTALGVLIGLMHLGALAAVGDRVKAISGLVGEIGDELGAAVAGVKDQVKGLGGQVEVVSAEIHAQAEAVEGQVERVADDLEVVASQVELTRADVTAVGGDVAVVGVEVSRLAQWFAEHHAQVVSVITQIPHGIAALFFVLSPTGVSIPVSSVLCTSYEDLDRILKSYICGRQEPGSRYVERGDYNIVSPDGEVVPPDQFNMATRNNINALDAKVAAEPRLMDGRNVKTDIAEADIAFSYAVTIDLYGSVTSLYTDRGIK
ncbi:hypothetical protein B0H16DRAFT_1757323 [Mycena metata]|uniref:Ubiquitin-like domain-containing protein n=1 Tax=Mycena metata TaxID=1033252 RepID=A0AAD7IG85_9AGAR|nr:hypothetical protein B0H16DRAFT_1757323 [Mycena metata]